MDISQMSEAVLQDRLHNFFGRWFDVYFEQRSICGTCRIDLIMFHNSDKSRNYPIGIEIKKGQRKRGVDIADWCIQAKRYADALFFKKRTFVFTAPQISSWYLEEGKLVAKHDVECDSQSGRQHNVNSFLYSAFGIGELQKYKTHYPSRSEQLRLVMNHQEIWTSKTPTVFQTQILDSL